MVSRPLCQSVGKRSEPTAEAGMSDKRQDTNSTFVNSIAYENGVKVNFEERGINTSLDNAQVITRDKEIEQIDTTLHTDINGFLIKRNAKH
ncbi:hypothetical protein [Fusobacterium sp. PH5-44]|uniref:hypothetical protein n=1 Tax=unclassified Fusobacterium TaxID=2648384 RepID=UPI003D1B11D5